MANFVCKSWKVVKVKTNKKCCWVKMLIDQQIKAHTTRWHYSSITYPNLNYRPITTNFSKSYQYRKLRCFLIGQSTRIVQIITIWALDCQITKKLKPYLNRILIILLVSNIVTIFWQNIYTQSISMHFQCLSMICSLWQQNWLHSVITQKICKFICKQSHDFGVQKSMYISTGYLILKCKNWFGSDRWKNAR